MLDQSDEKVGHEVACLGKEQHSRAMAKKIALRYPTAEIYRCLHCGHWHLGHGKAPRRRKMKIAR